MAKDLHRQSHGVDLRCASLSTFLGPNISFISHDESYIVDDEADCSYDSTNVFNIFEHELQIKKKIKSTFHSIHL